MKNSALALEFRLHQVLDVMVQEQVYAVVDGIEVQFAALQHEVENLTKSLDDHVKLGEIASGQYVPRYPEHSAKDILRQLFRELEGVEVNCMFRARVDIDALHHATSNLELNANKYKRDSPQSKVVKAVRMCKDVHPAPSAFDAVVTQGLQIGDQVPTGPEQGATIMALLHIVVSNEVTPDDFEMLKALHSKRRLHSLCEAGIRVAGERHASSSAGEGLALTKSVCESLFATFWVKLDTDAKTIHFNITVPVLFVTSKDSDSMPSGTGIIAVDDCSTQRLGLRMYLRKMQVPYQILGEFSSHFDEICDIASNFASQPAVTKLVVILDQNLSANPLILGTQLADRLRECRCQFDINTLVILIRSANTMTDDLKLYLQHADGFLEKSDSFSAIRSKIISHLHVLAEHEGSRDKDGDDKANPCSMEDLGPVATQMQAVILKDAEDLLLMNQSNQWGTVEARKQLHSLKGSIKCFLGVLADHLSRVRSSVGECCDVTEIDEMWVKFDVASPQERTDILLHIQKLVRTFRIHV